MSGRRKIKAKAYKEEGQKIKKYKKATIPKAIREQTWVQTFGEAILINVMYLGVKTKLVYLIIT